VWDRAKAIEAIVYLAGRINSPTKMKIFKILYLADKLHMSRYGRFIIGDNYVAMQHGPVPSKTYAIVKQVENGSYSDAFAVPTTRQITPLRPPNLRDLSESDIECFEETLREHGRKTAKQLRDITHGDAWNRVSNRGEIFSEGSSSSQSVPIPLEFIVDELPNAAAVRELLQIEGYLPLK